MKVNVKFAILIISTIMMENAKKVKNIILHILIILEF